jgi:hypothetical protein
MCDPCTGRENSIFEFSTVNDQKMELCQLDDAKDLWLCQNPTSLAGVNLPGETELLEVRTKGG